MRRVEFGAFRGLDARRLSATEGGNVIAACKNVSLTTARTIVARDQLRLFAEVAPEALGLYVVDDTLRCALPYPALTGPVPRPPLFVVYDLLADRNGQAFNGTVLQVASVAAWDNDPYLSVEMAGPGGLGTEWRHFHPTTDFAFQGLAVNPDTMAQTVEVTGLDPSTIGVGATVWWRDIVPTPPAQVTGVEDLGGGLVRLTLDAPPPASPTLFGVLWPQRNQVALPFPAGPSVITVGNKVWADDIETNNAWFSSTQNGPSDWLAVDDAGFLPTANHAGGSQPIRGFGAFQNRLVVFYEASIQVWGVGEDPAAHYLTDTIGGAGTLYPRTVANILGDLIYFGYGGFRSMEAVVATGQAKDTDIGAPIQPLTAAVDLNALPVSPIGVWSAWRSQYVAVLGQEAFVLTYSPTGGVADWTRWELPWPIEAIVEWRNRLIVRRAGTGELWEFDPEWTHEVGFNWSVRFYSVAGDAERNESEKLKHFKFFDIDHEGTAVVSAVFGGSETDTVEFFTLAGQPFGRVTFNCLAVDLAVRFIGDGPWTLDNYGLRYTVGNDF